MTEFETTVQILTLLAGLPKASQKRAFGKVKDWMLGQDANRLGLARCPSEAPKRQRRAEKGDAK